MANKIQNYLDSSYDVAKREIIKISLLSGMFVAPTEGGGAVYCTNTKQNIFLPPRKMTKDAFVATLVSLCGATGVEVSVVRDLVIEKEGVEVKDVLIALEDGVKKSYVVDYDVEKEGPMTPKRFSEDVNQSLSNAMGSSATKEKAPLARLNIVKNNRNSESFKKVLDEGYMSPAHVNELVTQLRVDIEEIEDSVQQQYSRAMVGLSPLEK